MQVTQYLDSIPVSEIQVGDVIVRPWCVHYVSSITELKEFGCKNINLKQLGEVSKDLVDQTYSTSTSRIEHVYFDCQKTIVVRYPKGYFITLNESVRAFKKKIKAIKVSSETSLSEIISAVRYAAPVKSEAGELLSGYELARYNQELDLYKHIKSLIQIKLEYCNLSDFGGALPVYVTSYQLADCILAGDTLDKLRERNKTCADAYAEIDRLNQAVRDAWKVNT